VTSLSDSGTIRFRVTESVDGEVDALGAPEASLTHKLSGFPNVPPFDFAYILKSLPFRHLKVEVLDNSSGDSHTLSVFLYAVP